MHAGVRGTPLLGLTEHELRYTRRPPPAGPPLVSEGGNGGPHGQRLKVNYAFMVFRMVLRVLLPLPTSPL